ncbi:hypothetical protein Tco_1244671 [Tanacetum coccineum]
MCGGVMIDEVWLDWVETLEYSLAHMWMGVECVVDSEVNSIFDGETVDAVLYKLLVNTISRGKRDVFTLGGGVEHTRSAGVDVVECDIQNVHKIIGEIRDRGYLSVDKDERWRSEECHFGNYGLINSTRHGWDSVNFISTVGKGPRSERLRTTRQHLGVIDMVVGISGT